MSLEESVWQRQCTLGGTPKSCSFFKGYTQNTKGVKQRIIRIEKVADISILKGNSLPVCVNLTSLPQKMRCTSVNIVNNSGWYAIGNYYLLKLRYLPPSQFLWSVLLTSRGLSIFCPNFPSASLTEGKKLSRVIRLGLKCLILHVHVMWMTIM